MSSVWSWRAPLCMPVYQSHPWSTYTVNSELIIIVVQCLLCYKYVRYHTRSRLCLIAAQPFLFTVQVILYRILVETHHLGLLGSHCCWNSPWRNEKSINVNLWSISAQFLNMKRIHSHKKCCLVSASISISSSQHNFSLNMQTMWLWSTFMGRVPLSTLDHSFSASLKFLYNVQISRFPCECACDTKCNIIFKLVWKYEWDNNLRPWHEH